MAKAKFTKEERQDAIDVGLRLRNIELHPELLRKVLEVVDLVDKKGLKANIKDIVELDSKLDSKEQFITFTHRNFKNKNYEGCA